jgi:hypothetical protein
MVSAPDIQKLWHFCTGLKRRRMEGASRLAKSTSWRRFWDAETGRKTIPARAGPDSSLESMAEEAASSVMASY